MKHNNKQPFNKTKKGLSILMAIILATFGFASCKKDDKEIDENSAAQEETLNDLELTEDFDIADKAAVRKRAKAIHDLLSKEIAKKVSVSDIMQIIYYYNGQSDALKTMLDDIYSKDSDKVLAVKNLSNNFDLILGDNIADDVSVMSGNIKKAEKDKEIYAYMFLAGGEEKSYAIDFALIVDEQLKNIEALDSSSYNDTAVKYHDYIMEIKNNKKLSNEVKTAVLLDGKAKVELTTSSGLTEEQRKNLMANNFNDSLGAMFDAIMEAWNFESVLMQMELDAQANDAFDRNHTQLGEKYNSKNDKESVTYPYISKEEETKTVDKGGNKVNGSTGKQEVIKPAESTTKVEETTWIEELPTDKITVTAPSEDGKEEETFVVEIPTDGGYVDVFVPGGEVVEEYTVSGNYVDEDVINEYYDEETAQKAEEMEATFNKSL